jgi:hypothetical protein
LPQFANRHIGPDETVRITIIKPISSLGPELLGVNALDALGEMSGYEKAGTDPYITAMDFARASLQQLHRDIGPQSVFWTYAFTRHV